MKIKRGSIFTSDELEKHETSLVGFRGRLTKYADTCGWVLCVGAGISAEIFPSWNELAESFFKTTGLVATPTELAHILNTFGAEALIQAAVNWTHMTSTGLLKKLSKTLYRPIKERAGASWPTVAKALSCSRPSNLTKREWIDFRSFIETYSRPSAPGIAQAVAAVADSPKRPEAIISFNAEPSLAALINCYYALHNPKAIDDSGTKILKRMSHDLASKQRGQIPYYYVHGLLPVPEGRTVFNEQIAKDKLVFTESQYLQMSGSVYSWQSATFLASCSHHRFVFIGLSFADANLRRWLAWGYQGKQQQRRQQNKPMDRPTHFWICQRPHPKGARKSTQQVLAEQSVAHLGVQVIWIDKWTDTGKTLESMLADYPKI